MQVQEKTTGRPGGFCRTRAWALPLVIACLTFGSIQDVRGADSREPSSSVTAGTTAAPAADSQIKFPDEPDKALKIVIDAFVNNRPYVVWQAMPARYRRDISDLIKLSALSLDDDIYDNGYGILRKFAKLTKTHEARLLRDPLVAQIFSDKKAWSSLVGILEILTSEELSSRARVKKMDINAFVKTHGVTAIRHLDVLSKLAPNDPMGQLKSVWRNAEVSYVSGNRFSAVVVIQGKGVRRFRQEMELVRIDDRWVPVDLARQWAKTMLETRGELGEGLTNAIGKAKPQIMAMLKITDQGLDAVVAAKTDAEVEKATKLVLTPLLMARQRARGMQASTQMRGIHQQFVVYAQSNKGWYPDSDPQGKKIRGMAETLHQLLVEDFYTIQYAIHPNSQAVSPGGVGTDNAKLIEFIRKNSVMVFLPGLTETLRTTELFGFENPEFTDGKTLQLIWQDNHVTTATMDEAKQIIKKQSGKTMEHWLKEK